MPPTAAAPPPCVPWTRVAGRTGSAVRQCPQGQGGVREYSTDKAMDTQQHMKLINSVKCKKPDTIRPILYEIQKQAKPTIFRETW